MYHLHLIRNLRSLAFLLIALAIGVSVGSLIWINHTGLPASWRLAIQQQISKQGTFVKIGSLSYHPIRGVIAKKIQIFSDIHHQQKIATLERVILDFDNSQLIKGNIQLTKVELNDATLSLPVDPKMPDSEVIEIRHANGIFIFNSKHQIDIQEASGEISGIQVTLNSRLTKTPNTKVPAPEPQPIDKRKKLLTHIIHELEKWHFDPTDPPRLEIFIEGETHQMISANAKISLSAKSIGKNQHIIEDLHAQAELKGNILTLTSLHAKDARGKIKGSLDFDLTHQSGRFDIQSSLEIPALLQSWLGMPPLRDIIIAGHQELEASGEFSINAEQKPQIQITGQAKCESALLRGIPFDTIQSSFAWSNGDLFLRDIQLNRTDGSATGKALIQWPIVRIALDSTLPSQLYKPLFTGKPLETVINSFEERADPHTHILLEGGFDATAPQSWAYKGSGTLKNTRYKGVPINYAHCGFSLSSHSLDFYDGHIIFDYTDYPLRQKYEGPKTGAADVKRIFYQRADKSITVESVSGTIWPAPLVRLFAPKIADSLESYRFHTPPKLLGYGNVNIGGTTITSLDINFQTTGQADYEFLDKDLTLTDPAGSVFIRDQNVSIKNLTSQVFAGPITAKFDFTEKDRIEGELQWTQLSMPQITSTYEINMKGGGDLTGRIDFSLQKGKIETMNAKGLFALDRTELFSVPMFGPLSSVISSVLGDSRAGFERAKSAFGNFKITNGILTTDDFNTSTTSLVFAGDGSVNLKDRTLDMTMRLNARGILGLLTLPLRPFYGMFQFRGTGPLNNTHWEHVLFTTPTDSQKELLLNPPKAQVVTPEN